MNTPITNLSQITDRFRHRQLQANSGEFRISLMEKTGATSNENLNNIALQLLDWCCNELDRNDTRVIGSHDPLTESFKELSLPWIMRIKSYKLLEQENIDE